MNIPLQMRVEALLKEPEAACIYIARIERELSETRAALKEAMVQSGLSLPHWRKAAGLE